MDTEPNDMEIGVNYDNSVNIERLAAGDGDTEEYAAHISGIKCHIQPLDDAMSETGDGRFGKDWMMFCDDMDIKEGDHVKEGAITYSVVGVERMTFLGEARHMEVRIRLFI